MEKLVFALLIFATFIQSSIASKAIDVDEEINFNEPWYKNNRSDEENLKRLVNALKKVPTGKNILQKATEKASQSGQTLFDVVAMGNGSLTDTTLVRKFQASNPTHVIYETRSKVYLAKHLKTLDALLDFAHELTHYSFREPFNPYDKKFHLKDFIKSTVEGRGGEVDAYLVECQVLKELFPGSHFRNSNCQRVYSETSGQASKDLGVQEFYKVGNHFENLKKDLEKFSVTSNELPASSAEALFISSAWGLPYPVAAVREYVNIMDRVCKNDQNRLSLMQNKLGRSIASESSTDQSDYLLMFEDFKARCAMFVSL